MTVLMIDLLGAPRVSLAGQPLDLRARKELALLAYLAVESERPHRRDHLTGLLWPDVPEEAARNNLRVVLARLRRTLGGVAGAVLQIDRQQVQFLPTAEHIVDVLDLRRLLAAVRAHSHVAIEGCDACIAQLAVAAERHSGEFLAGFSLPGSAPFDEWATVQREQLHQQQLDTLDTLASAAARRGDHAAQCAYARRQLALEPWRESAYAQLMRGLWASGQRGAALDQYEHCRRILAGELGLEPSPELATLAEQLRGAAAPPPGVAAPSAWRAAISQSTLEPQPGWPEIPTVARLYGRVGELVLLRRWLLDERCRLVALLGIGGVGKTTLAAAATGAVAGHFAAVVWRSLLNAPPLDELLHDILGQLVPGAPVQMPPDQESQLGLLLAALCTSRCLLVLDNLESILHADDAGHMAPGYEGYARLLRAVAEQPHQSCVLLTSRERPQGLEQFEAETLLVRLLRLGGLDVEAGTQMLVARGLQASGDGAGVLVRRYSGNPLALRLVAQTVREVFGGDVRAFLETEALIFGNIGAVLDQQITRLSPLERELLTWLAIEREPTGALALRANLVSPGPPRATLEAVRALLRRSLVSQSGSGLGLQNVVTEYLTDALITQVVREIADDLEPGAPSADDPAAALNRFSLRKARTRDYVRASQSRLILEPVAERARERLGRAALTERLRAIVVRIQARGEQTPGYAAGNILNLLLHLGAELRGADFSGLCVWQASLERAHLPEVRLAGCDLTGSNFSYSLEVIHAVQFDADGQLQLAIFLAGRLHLWRNAEGQLREEQTFGDGTSMVVFGPDRHTLISWHTDGRMRVWNSESGELQHTLDSSGNAPWLMAPGPDGGTIATGHASGEVLVWDVASGAVRLTLRGHTAAVPALAFSPDGQMLASGDVDGMICLWWLASGELIRTLASHSQEVHVLAFDPTNGELLASASHDRTVCLWDVPSGQVRHVLRTHREMIRVMAFSPDGRTLASGGGDTFICLWDVSTGQLRHVLPDLRQRCMFLAYDPNGLALATIGSNQMICVWSAESGQRLETITSYMDQIISLDISPDGAQLLSGGMSGFPRIWDVVGGQPGRRALVGHTDRVQAVSWSPGGELVASAGCDRVIRLWDAGTGRGVRMLHGHSHDVEHLQFSPDGRWLLSCSRDGTVRRWESASGETLQLFRGHTEDVLCCAVGPGGRLVASGSMDRTVRLWDVGLNGGDVARVLSGHTAAVRCVAFSPDGQLLLSSGLDQQLLVWNVDDGRVRYAFPAHHTVTISIAFHPDGELVATADQDYIVRLWRMAPDAVRLCAELHGHSGVAAGVRFSPDGRRLYSASMDASIREWDAATGASLRILRDQGPYVGMDITGASGITTAQRAGMVALGAVDGA